MHLSAHHHPHHLHHRSPHRSTIITAPQHHHPHTTSFLQRTPSYSQHNNIIPAYHAISIIIIPAQGHHLQHAHFDSVSVQGTPEAGVIAVTCEPVIALPCDSVHNYQLTAPTECMHAEIQASRRAPIVFKHEGIATST